MVVCLPFWWAKRGGGVQPESEQTDCPDRPDIQRQHRSRDPEGRAAAWVAAPYRCTEALRPRPIQYRPGTVWSLPMLLCLLAGLLGTLPLVILTPPFQVPDEAQHFERAYQISEGGLRAEVRDGVAGARLPASLPALVRKCLGTDAILAVRRVAPAPLTRSAALRAIPLDPKKQQFVDFTGAAVYPPLAYLPQAAGIAIGRAFGAGPLVLLYLARAANALAAVALLALAIGLLPAGKGPALLTGLLPMALYEYASVSPDALVISASFLLTALGLQALKRGTWQGGEVAGAALAGLLVCATKPVYAPLLLIAAPALLSPERRWHHARALAVILGVALGGTLLWFTWNTGRVITFEPDADLHAQLMFVLTHPDAAARALETSVQHWGWYYLLSMIGIFGWLTVVMPGYVYILAAAALIVASLIGQRAESRLAPIEVAWCALLLAGALSLTFLAMYLDATPVGARVVLGVQGRYFLPLLGLAAAVVGSLPVWRLGERRAPVMLTVLAGVALLEAAVAMHSIISAFKVV